jgi:cation diffusion facilitator family transporter
VIILRGPHHRHGDGALHHDHDHTLRAAHLHVLADALTSVLAIFALLAAKYAGAVWMDPAMGIVGGALVARWSWGLLTATSRVLLDRQAPETILEHLRGAVESSSVRVIDLHVWEIGPGCRAAIVSLESEHALSPAEVEASIPAELGIAHLTVELRGPSGLNTVEA